MAPDNPFEITPSNEDETVEPAKEDSKPTETESKDTLTEDSLNRTEIIEEENLGIQPNYEGNPFEKRRGEESFTNPIVGLDDRFAPISNEQRAVPKTAASKLKNFKLISIILMLLFLASLTTFFRLFILKTYESFLSDNFLRTNFRATGSSLSIPYFLLEVFFVLNFSLTLFLLLNNFNYDSGYIFKDFFFCLMIVSGLVFGKHLIIWLIGNVFPIQKETSVYNFTIANFYIILGLILVPLNLFLAYAPASFMTIITYITGILCLGILLYLAFRGLLIGLKYLSTNRFHFFMYLCTVEIAPVLITLKMLVNYIGS